ncbi:hypothetical protein PV08_11427 [Exophiala spinifera]|uniref:Uncharacterized protein n=1 Tax=Exophiala spinifera TaxID=91928 RepID=A0A0D2AUQ9_9EURO|nr:uncharacterized protein PV08_11427 [Exophiala spinifera]KIW10463.1 hypothetical protein PV08_11427 [Exophiala spinifera]
MELSFINHGANTRGLSEADRSTIRRVSRQVGAATRKANGNGKKVNTLQIPDFLMSSLRASDQVQAPPTNDPGRQKLLKPELRAFDPQAPKVSKNGSEDQLRMTTIPPALSFKPNGRPTPPAMSVFMMPDLTVKLLDYAVNVDLLANPARWVKAFRLSSPSALQILPQRYGFSKCLDDAIDCAAGRIRLCLAGDEQVESDKLEVDKLYGRALRSLSLALSSSSSVDWTVWYATLTLLLSEVLDNSSHHGWIMHARGAFEVLLALGPDRINTEVKRDLLITQAGGMIMEATFANIDCFLRQPEWQSALHRCIDPSSKVGKRSESAIKLWMILARAPGIFRSITGVVLLRSTEDRVALIDQLRVFLTELISWGSHLRSETGSFRSQYARKHYQSTTTRYLLFLTLAYRFQIAIDVTSAPLAEANVVEGATYLEQIIDSHQHEPVSAPTLRLAKKVVDSVNTTTASWSQAQSSDTADQPGTIAPELFTHWSALVGRVV